MQGNATTSLQYNLKKHTFVAAFGAGTAMTLDGHGHRGRFDGSKPAPSETVDTCASLPWFENMSIEMYRLYRVYTSILVYIWEYNPQVQVLYICVHLRFCSVCRWRHTSFLYSLNIVQAWRPQFQELQISSLSGALCSLSAKADWHGRELKEAIFKKVHIPCSDWALLLVLKIVVKQFLGDMEVVFVERLGACLHPERSPDYFSNQPSTSNYIHSKIFIFNLFNHNFMYLK